MAYVGMTRGRDENHLAIYPAAISASQTSCSGWDLGARAARLQISIAPLVPMCQKLFGD